MRKALLIFGASGHARVVAEIAQLCGWDQLRFYDDKYVELNQRGDVAIEGAWEQLLRDSKEAGGAFVAIGNNSIRERKVLELLDIGIDMPVLQHPSATVSGSAEIGQGTVLMAGTVVNPNVRIGRGAIINTGACVDHDCRLGDFVHLSPAAALAGGVQIGDRAWLGINSTVIQGINVGEDCVIGAGSVVLDNVPSGLTAVGVPARPLSK